MSTMYNIFVTQQCLLGGLSFCQRNVVVGALLSQDDRYHRVCKYSYSSVGGRDWIASHESLYLPIYETYCTKRQSLDDQIIALIVETEQLCCLLVCYGFL